ncbi:MAG: WG repeat-containing protein [Alloprevotella sp.]
MNGAYLELCGIPNIVVDSNGSIIATDTNHNTFELSDNVPIIVSKDNLYVKLSHKTMPLNGCKIEFNNVSDYYVLVDGHGNRSYYNFDCQQIDATTLMKSRNGISISKINNKYCFISSDGKQIGTSYDDVHPMLWVEDMVAVKLGDKWGFVNSKGTCVIEPQYNSAESFLHGLALVDNGDYISYAKVIDTKGNIVYTINDRIQAFDIDKSNGNIYFRYLSNNPVEMYGVYNVTTGRRLKGLSSVPIFKDGYAIVTDSRTYKCGICDIEGNMTIPMQYDNVTHLGEGLVCVNQGTYQYLYSLKGEKMLDLNKVGLSIQGGFNYGVAPAMLLGIGSVNNCGYIYNVYTNKLDNIITQYGSLGNNDNTALAQDIVNKRLEYTDFLMSMGERALKNGHFLSAFSLYDRLTAFHSTYAPAYYGKGSALMQQEEYEQAISCFEQAALLQPDNVDTYYMLALCYNNVGDVQKALTACNKLLRFDNNHAEGLALRKELNQRKTEKRHRRLDAIMVALNNLNNITAQLYNMTATSKSHQTKYTSSQTSRPVEKRRDCSLCNGTGYNSGKERPPFYSYNEETYSNSPCEVCGDRDNHYHKPCPRCMGKGYTNY